MEEWLQMVEDCEEREERLSDWERQFIASIKVRLEEGSALTSAQDEKLNDIWNKATERG